MKDKQTRIWIPLIGAIIFVCGMWAGYLLTRQPQPSLAKQKLDRVFDLIEKEYVDSVSLDSLVELAIPAMLKNLDPHSVYIPVSDLERVNREIESSFFGIGIQFQMLSDTVCVVEVIGGGPAERAGLLPGDRIISVDDVPMVGENISTEDVFSRLRGENGTKVKVTVKRNSTQQPISFVIVRGEIPSTSVDASYMVDESTGYIRLNKFAANTHSEFYQAAGDLRARGAKNFILDLRGNGGGLLDQAILIANELLAPERLIVSVRGRNPLDNENWMADGTGSFTDQQLVVLVDEFSASAAEIVAGAVQDNDRGLIVGRRTFGKGLVQRQISLPDSSQLRLTVQRYYTPAGRSIQKDFERGKSDSYDMEVFDRFSNGEVFSADSTKFDRDKAFKTYNGRDVYGGGGILPDVFVPSDTSGLTSYYFKVADSGLLNEYAYQYADANRNALSKASNVDQLMKLLPSNDVLLWEFVNYAAENGVPKRWYYINISADLITTQLKALIARDILGVNAYYQIYNTSDKALNEALRQLREGIKSKLTP